MAKKKAPKLKAKAPKASASRLSQPTHTFSLIYSGVAELTDEVEDALYERHCDDAVMGFRAGVCFVDFARQAPSFRIALMSAILDVERTGLPLELLRVEPL